MLTKKQTPDLRNKRDDFIRLLGDSKIEFRNIKEKFQPYRLVIPEHSIRTTPLGFQGVIRGLDRSLRNMEVLMRVDGSWAKESKRGAVAWILECKRIGSVISKGAMSGLFGLALETEVRACLEGLKAAISSNIAKVILFTDSAAVVTGL